jgi:hypothetical protein
MALTTESLDGLPSMGPSATHYHQGNVTPWNEGHVLRVTGNNGAQWVGNFQSGDSYYSDTVLWAEASLLVVVASGACYFVSTEFPDQYVCHQTTVTGVLFNEARTKLFVADYRDLYAYDSTGAVIWKHESLAVDGIELKECRSGFVMGRACDDPHPEVWSNFKLRENDGTSGFRD